MGGRGGASGAEPSRCTPLFGNGPVGAPSAIGGPEPDPYSSGQNFEKKSLAISSDVLGCPTDCQYRRPQIHPAPGWDSPGS